MNPILGKALKAIRIVAGKRPLDCLIRVGVKLGVGLLPE